ncbi:MAG: hypothetical protein ACLSFT_09820 [Ruminococcus callidus]
MDNNKRRNSSLPADNRKRAKKGGTGIPMRKYYGPTGTPEYPYHSPELEEAAAKPKWVLVLRQTLSILGSTLAAMFMILIITCTIVATALVVYVMNFRDDVSNVTIEEMELSYNTNIYAQDSSGEWVNILKSPTNPSVSPLTSMRFPSIRGTLCLCRR